MASQVEALAAAVRVITSEAREMAAQLAALERDIEGLAARVGGSGLSSSSQGQARVLQQLLHQAGQAVRGATRGLEQSARVGDRYASGIADGGRAHSPPKAQGGSSGGSPPEPPTPPRTGQADDDDGDKDKDAEGHDDSVGSDRNLGKYADLAPELGEIADGLAGLPDQISGIFDVPIPESGLPEGLDIGGLGGHLISQGYTHRHYYRSLGDIAWRRFRSIWRSDQTGEGSGSD